MRIKPRYIPRFAILSAILFAISSVLFLVSAKYAPAADFFNGTVCHLVRRVLAYITSPLPVSLFEGILYLIPTFALFAILYAVRIATDKRRAVRFLAGLIALLMFLGTLYTLTLGIAYRTTRLEERISLPEVSVSAETLHASASEVLAELSPLIDTVEYDAGGSSVMPYDLSVLSEKLGVAYGAIEERFGIVKAFESTAKPIYASVAMSHLDLLGIYSFLTGEANVNVDYPDYNLPFTVAHEMAHQRGIAREDEANFVAFLVCSHSEDAYIRYSGYLNLYVYLSNALYRTDKDLSAALTASLDPRALSELRAESAHAAKYDIEFIAKLSDTVNDTYLKLNGTEGTVSYGLVVRLAVAYLSSL